MRLTTALAGALALAFTAGPAAAVGKLPIYNWGNYTNPKLIEKFEAETGIKGSIAFMPEEMRTAPEVVIPAEFADKGHFLPTCAPDVQAIYTRVWTDLQK